MPKTYRMAYRVRVYFCKKCDVHLEIVGMDIAGVKCRTCGKAVSSLKKESDNFHRVVKQIVAWADRAQLASSDSEDSVEA